MTDLYRLVVPVQIELVRGSIVNVGGETVPPVFLVVTQKVLRAGLDADGLDALNRRIGGFAGQIGIGAKTTTIKMVRRYYRMLRITDLSQFLPAFGLREMSRAGPR